MSIPSTTKFVPNSPKSRFQANGVPTSLLTAKIGAALSRWSRRRADQPEAALDLFADCVADVNGSGSIEAMLLTLAVRIAGPGVCEVVLTSLNGGVVRAEHRPTSTARVSTTHVVEFPLRFDGEVFGSIRIVLAGPNEFSPERYRRLSTLATFAAAVDLAKSAPRDRLALAPPVIAVHPTHDPATGLPNAAFLAPFLAHTLTLADRRREPVSILSIGVDRLSAIRKLLGVPFADTAIGKVGRIIAGTLRSSDLIARLPDGVLVAVLPGASVEDAQMVAETVRSAVALHGAASTAMPMLTASIGIATYPDHANDPVGLRSTAAAALVEARSLGRNCIFVAEPLDPDKTTILRLSTNAD